MTKRGLAMCSLPVVLMGITLGTNAASAQTVIYVDRSAAGAGDGSSWADAFTRVQYALNAAQSGDQVWVAGGTYVELITLADGVALYGGFAGDEDPATFDLADRDLEANQSILDAHGMGSVVRAPAGATTTTRIDGFTITNGDSDYGGGIYLADASPTIANNTIVNNRADMWGGGLHLQYSSALIVNNTITDNHAVRYGGALDVIYSSPVITGNAIKNNRADRSGGALAAAQSSPTIANNIIHNNRALDLGGALYLLQSSSLTIANNTITSNAAWEGGGLHLVTSSATITNNTICSNTAQEGGGLYLDDSNPAIFNTIIAFNATGISRNGAGTPQLRYNCVYGNDGYDYAGIADPTGMDGNISIDPLLAAPRYGNVHIQPGSPCLDAGSNGFAYGSTDVDGEPRIQSAGGTIDIGADESAGTVWPPGPYIVVRVSTQGDDANDGSSWGAAKRSVQAAIDAAAALGGEVWVKAGSYEGLIILDPGVHLFGGFDGTETMRDQRDWAANTTILDGRFQASVVAVPTGHRVSTIDGFTVTRGYGSAGGGLFVTSSPTITNNRVVGNTSVYYGGGMYLAHNYSTIANNVIEGNSAGRGGGLFLSLSPTTICNNTITNNSASEDGGGIAVYSSPVTIANTIIALNSSGLYRNGLDMPSLRHNCVFGNEEYGYAGIADPTGSHGNIAADPLLAGPKFGNAHIQPDSPCVDAGTNALVSVLEDIDGETRIQPTGAIVDIGADESSGAPWPSGPYTIVHVSTEGDDADDGSSWALAKRTVQAAVNAASIAGGEVWVEAGTYNECVRLPGYAHLYGGFAGNEMQRDERDWVAHATILDAQEQGAVLTAETGYRVLTVDGFAITRGSAHTGGGISVYNSSPEIRNNTITQNNTTNGAGISLWGTSAVVSRNTISGNTATAYGGGMYVAKAPRAVIANNAIVNNSCRTGAALYLTSSSATVSNNTITNNNASGGVIVISDCVPRIVNTIVAYNSSGLLQNGSSVAVLRYNCVYGNAAYNYSGINDPTGFAGNISVDPRLAASEYGNVHIQPDSPCVDAGTNGAGAGDTDFDGDPRIDPAGGIVDIGADESDGITWSPGPYKVVRVSTIGDDANDGATWASAKRTIQAGIDAASAVGGDVWVAAGTYAERITLLPYAHLYGGFVGGETQRDQRDWNANRVVLDGLLEGPVVTARTGHQVSAIDGFTITHGDNDRYGGGLDIQLSSPRIAHNCIVGNEAAWGGGVNLEKSYSSFTNNLVAWNSGRFGGSGVYVRESACLIANNTIAYNDSISGAVHLFSSTPTILNTIVVFNESGVTQSYGSHPQMRYNCVYGNDAFDYNALADPTGTAGNIAGDPRFISNADPGPDGEWGTPDDDLGDLRLQDISPCVNAGTNGMIEAPTDLAGQPRLAGCRVDMGAYENQGPFGDFDDDCMVDLADYEIFEICLWLSGPNQPPLFDECLDWFDFDGETDIDLADFAAFQRRFAGS